MNLSDSAAINLADCTSLSPPWTTLQALMWNCAGPGVDLSDSASIELSDCTVAHNISGLMMWNMSHASLDTARIQGGVWPAILSDGMASLVAKVRGHSRVADSRVGYQCSTL